VRQGLLTRDQLDSGCWRRLLPDVYVHADIAVTHQIMCRSVALILPAGGALSGASAAYIHGADVLEQPEAVEVTLPHHARMRPQLGVAIRSGRLGSGDVIGRQGLHLTSLVRTAFDLARWRRPEREAVVAVDALLVKRHLTVEAIQDYARDRRGWPEVRRLARVLDLAACGAESPGETRLRLVLVGGELPRPVLQHRVKNCSGGIVARLDLAYPEHHLGIEYDGDCHWDRGAIKKDLIRQNTLRALGWSLLRFTSDDVHRHPARLLEQVRATLAD
jgi:hypothetical protein